MQVTFLYTKIGDELPQRVYLEALNRLPLHEKERNIKYRRWQDRQANILGKLLLHFGLKQQSLKISLNDIEYSEYKKPYLRNGPFFNISHSGNYVGCAISNEEIGVDIEQILDMDFGAFQKVFTPREWEYINQSKKDMMKPRFYQVWTRKESVIKANGKGMYIDLKDFDVLENRLSLYSERYLWSEVDIAPDYSCNITIKGTEVPLINSFYIEMDTLIRQQF